MIRHMGRYYKKTKKIKNTIRALTLIWMEQSMWEIGRRISRVVMERKYGQMELSTVVSILMVRRMVLEGSNGQMVLYTMGSL